MEFFLNVWEIYLKVTTGCINENWRTKIQPSYIKLLGLPGFAQDF
jgi:hypothetical protein